MGCDYSLFKKGIKPMWEDDANKIGGRWLINLDKRQHNQELDRIWLDVVCYYGLSETFTIIHLLLLLLYIYYYTFIIITHLLLYIYYTFFIPSCVWRILRINFMCCWWTDKSHNEIKWMFIKFLYFLKFSCNFSFSGWENCNWAKDFIKKQEMIF